MFCVELRAKYVSKLLVLFLLLLVYSILKQCNLLYWNQQTKSAPVTICSCKSREVYKDKSIMYTDEVMKKQAKKSK